MTDKVKYTIDTLGTNQKYFLEGTDYEGVFELINSQEKPIKIYKGCNFTDVLVVDKEGDHYGFYMNALIPRDRKKINDLVDYFTEEFLTDGIWLYNINTNTIIYDYVKKQSYGNWVLFSKAPHDTFLALDGEMTQPIKFYNAQNKSSLYWSLWYINSYLTNPLGSLAEEEGTRIILEYASKIFNLEPFANFEFSKQDILNAVGVYEENYKPPKAENMKAFTKKIVDVQYSKKEEEEIGLILSKEGKVYLSDLVRSKIPHSYFPVHIDLVLDPRILGVYVANGEIIFISSVELEERARNEIFAIMKPNKKHVKIEIENSDSSLEIQDQFTWFEKVNGVQNLGF
jgi:hypothetical protein